MTRHEILSRGVLPIVLIALGCGGHASAAQPLPGEPAISGSEPGTQKEADWVDNRWAETDIGPFLSSALRVPEGTIPKALSVRVGVQGQAGVVYDTRTLNQQAAWTGGFVRPDPARFGLIKAPAIQGELQFSQRGGAVWESGTVRFLGFHVRGPRLLLQYHVDGTAVMESPWYLEERQLFIRTFQIAPHEERLRLRLLSGIDPDPAGDPSGAETMTLVQKQGKGVIALTCLHDGRLTRSEENRSVTLVLPPSTKPQRVVLGIWTGEGRPSPNLATWLEEDPIDLRGLMRPGPTHWSPALETKGVRGIDTGPLAVDTLTLPYSNPWKAPLFLAGVDFTSDGTAYVCSLHGDVWRVSGIDGTLAKLSWRRFATGLYQPLGLKVRDDRIFVLGRDRITRLHDENNDGEADFYESFFDGIDTSIGGHDYVTSLEQDGEGNFYYVDPKGVHRVSWDGRKKETLATGFRNPNGTGVSPDGKVVTVAPQQGEWTPSSLIAEIKPGNYYGYGGPKITSTRPLGYDAPLCWLPHSVDNSSGSQVWIPPGHWGPLGGQMLHLLWGRCGLALVLRDAHGDVSQGACFVLPAKFLSGPNRATWNPRDDALYVAGSTGWQTSAVKDGALQRVRWTGRKVCWPMAWEAHTNGLELRFSMPLKREVAADTGSYALQWWNYRYAAQYGSKDWSVANPDQQGRDTVEIKSARLGSDNQTVFVEVPGLRPVMQYELKWNLDEENGKRATGVLYGTINGLR